MAASGAHDRIGTSARARMDARITVPGRPAAAPLHPGAGPTHGMAGPPEVKQAPAPIAGAIGVHASFHNRCAAIPGCDARAAAHDEGGQPAGPNVAIGIPVALAARQTAVMPLGPAAASAEKRT